MRFTSLLVGAAALTAAGELAAQTRVTPRDRDRARVFSFGGEYDSDRPVLGISTASGGERDTLGLLITHVTPGGPADKAGLEEGNRIASINGVNLKLSPADAGERDMAGMTTRRLTRELSKVKAGDEVELRVYANGQLKTVRVRPVVAEDLPPRERRTREDWEDRPVLGMSLSASGSRRDTLGMLVVRVATDGPAEKAGIVEGDRVASINGVDLRVPREDAGDGYVSGAKMGRFRRELNGIRVGQDVELRVYSGGQTKTVRVKPVRAEELSGHEGAGWFFGDGAWAGEVMPVPPIPPIPPMAPMPPRIFRYDIDGRDGLRYYIEPRTRIEIGERIREATERAREAGERAGEAVRRAVERFQDSRIHEELHEDLRDELEDLRDFERDAARDAAREARREAERVRERMLEAASSRRRVLRSL